MREPRRKGALMISLRLNVVPLGLACCALEYHAAMVSEQLASAWLELTPPATEREGASNVVADGASDVVDVLVLAGTMTHALMPTIKEAYNSLGSRRAVVSFGACSISGGPYWDSYSVVNEAPVPVDITIPGCPPTPQALVDGLKELQAVLMSGNHVPKPAGVAGVQ